MAGILVVFRKTFEHFGVNNLPDDEIKAMFGPTEEGILERVLPGQLETSLPYFLNEYEHQQKLEPLPFKGMERIFTLLRQKGIRVAIVTGKGIGSTEITMRILGMTSWVDEVETGFAEAANKPLSMRRVLERWGIDPQQAAYVGDTSYDMQSAREVGVLPLGAAWAVSPLLGEGNSQAANLFFDVESFAKWVEDL